MWVWYVILALVAVILLYLFLIFPAGGKKARAFDGKYIAHRGLHGGEVIENTLPAFERAVARGYGVELDIQLSKDGIPIVCHDYDLKRVFDVDQKVSALDAEELHRLGVPYLSEVLALLNGRVPLVAEMKGESADTTVCVKAAELLDAYEGLYCVESFNPLLMRWFKKHRPQVIRGQLSTAFGKKRDGKRNLLHGCLRHLLLNFLSRPHFIAYEYCYCGLSVRLCRRLGALTICWTPKSEEACERARRIYSAFIFEGFEPKT